MDRFQLGPIQLTRNPSSNDLLLLVKGPTLYKSILGRAFPSLYFSRTFPDRFGRFDWGTYVRGADAAQESSLREFCDLLHRVIYLDDDLDESFTLSFHTQMSVTGGYERTAVGKLVRAAKPYDLSGSPGDRDKARELATLYAEFIRAHPTYRSADCLVAVPPSNVSKAFDLPTVLAEEVAAVTRQVNATAALRKTRPTRPMKQCRTVQEKIDNLKDAFSADPAVFAGKRVILIDDIYETGFSMNEAGRSIREAGVSSVLGLAATKTTQDMSEDQDSSESDYDIP